LADAKASLGGDLRASAKAAWRRLRGGELTPLRAALSVAIGLAIGVLPTWGFHLWLVLAVCIPLRLDAPVAYLAANISIPPMIPVIGLIELEIGAFVRNGRFMEVSLSDLRAGGAVLFAKEVGTGAALFAPSLGLVGGMLTLIVMSLVKRAPAAKSELEAAVERVSERYAQGQRRAAYHYVKSKLSGDAVVEAAFALAKEEPLGDVVDVGCGRGQLGVLLLELGVATRVVGFDWDEAKVTAARDAAKGLPASYRRGDLREAFEETGDAVLLVDVLHYLTTDEQHALLERAARAAKSRVIVRELDPDRGVRSRLTLMQERLTTGTGFNRGARVNARPIAELVAVLEREGLSVTVTPCWGGLPLSNVMVVGRRGTLPRPPSWPSPGNA
jgi:SAM-dependent methyltransferase/uncharacterized protein (DUF2062 family)